MTDHRAVLEDWSIVLDAIEAHEYVRAITILLERDTLDDAISTAQAVRRHYAIGHERSKCAIIDEGYKLGVQRAKR